MATILNGTSEDRLNRQERQNPVLKKPKTRGPLRVLVITTTHLVPGDSFRDKIKFLTNKVCRNVLGRDFNKLTDRRTTKDCTFGYSGRKCFFMLDYIGDENADGCPDFTTLMAAGDTPKKVKLKIPVRDVKEILRIQLRQEIEEIKSEPSASHGPHDASHPATPNENHQQEPKKRSTVLKIPMLQYRWDGANLVKDDATTLKIYRVLRKSYPFPIREDDPKSCLKKLGCKVTDTPAGMITSQRRALLRRLECMSIPSRKNIRRTANPIAKRGDLAWLEQQLGERGKEGQKIYKLFLAQVERAERMEEWKAAARAQAQAQVHL